MNKLFNRSMRYLPARYWGSRSDPNNSEGCTEGRIKTDTQFIAKNIENCKKVLDYGPGTGRTLSAYSDQHLITAVDLTDNYKESWASEAGRLNLKVEDYIVDPRFIRRRHDQVKYDAVVACQVLMHVPPKDIEECFRTLCSVGDRICIISRYLHTQAKPAAHVFEHNYLQLIEENKVEVDSLFSVDGIVYFSGKPLRS